MPRRLTQHLFAHKPEDLVQASAHLQAGSLVAFATETVYGLGADARNSDAVAQIYSAKGRPSFNPLIVHVPDVASAQKLVLWNETAQKLADAFWPGALTLVLPLTLDHGLSSLVTAGLETLAIRIPKQDSAQALLKLAQVPVAAPSANPSGRISPTTATHVLNGLSGKIAAVLDDGPCPVGLESTIIQVNNAHEIILLRHGGVASEDIEALLGQPLFQDEPNTGRIIAPGQLLSHYAPKAAVRLNAQHAEKGEVFLGFGDMSCDMNLSANEDLQEAAANLFSCLHRLDQYGQPIAICPIPNYGLGRAINDRLKRAAAPRM